MAGKRKATGCSNRADKNKRIKRRDQDHDVQNQSAMAVDAYTSQLPDLVVDQILLLLPTKYAVRASILSKQWARLWSLPLVPILDLEEDARPSSDQYRRPRTFLKFLRKCLECCKKDKHDLDKFRLCMSAKLIDKWLSLAVERNVKELDIILNRQRGDRSKYYNLPWTILNAKSLTSLRLENVKIKDNVSPISLPSLKTMILTNVELGDLGFVQLISGCPFIEYLSLTTSCALWNVKVSSSSLKSLKLTRCCKTLKYRSGNIVGFKVEAMNLESFRFDDYAGQLRMRDVDIFSCQTLRNLEFFSTLFEDQWFEEGLDSRFPLLKSLVLHNCIKMSDSMINVDSQHLKHLELFGTHNYLAKVKINTPNLLSFTFSSTGDFRNRFGQLLSSFSINAPNLLEATINFNFKFAGEDFPLINFLRKFDCSRKISLSVEDSKALIFPEDIRKTCSSPFPNLKHLKVVISSPEAVLSDSVLKDSLQWMAPALKSLYINEVEIFVH